MSKANKSEPAPRSKPARYGFHLENGLRQTQKIPAAYAALREARHLASLKRPDQS
ncbi:MAG: hypothetical protein GYB36_04180 [Alphaproteobacteria bacterium]|nr:hypothetical protein [Alphaproteobacteria bacterium]